MTHPLLDRLRSAMEQLRSPGHPTPVDPSATYRTRSLVVHEDAAAAIEAAQGALIEAWAALRPFAEYSRINPHGPECEGEEVPAGIFTVGECDRALTALANKEAK